MQQGGGFWVSVVGVMSDLARAKSWQMQDSKGDAAAVTHLSRKWNTQRAQTGIGVDRRMMSEV